MSTPSGTTLSTAPSRVTPRTFRSGSIAELHPGLIQHLEEADGDSIEVTFSAEEGEHPTQKIDRRPSQPSAPAQAESASQEQFPTTSARDSIAAPRDPLPTLRREATTEEHLESGDRHAKIPAPPPGPPIIPALRVAVHISAGGVPELLIHNEGAVADAPTAVLVPDSRADALRILRMFETAARARG